MSSGATFQSSVKRYTASRANIVLDDFDTEAIRCTIHEGISNIEETFESCKLLHRIGFIYKKVHNKRYVYKQPKIITGT